MDMQGDERETYGTIKPNKLPGEVRWTEFLHAMKGIGFVPKKLYGSVWSFTPKGERWGVEQAINFHGPHREACVQ